MTVHPRPNIRDVARLAEVSYQTVSRVLNESPNIKESTRQRVLRAIADSGYRPNQAARALVTSKSGTIGVLSQQTAQYGPVTSIHEIEQSAKEAGYRLSITNISSSDSSAIRAGLDYLLSQSVEAIVIIAPQSRVFDAIDELSMAVPFVTLQSTDLAAVHSMSIDQVAGARLATRHLIDLGHTEIVHIAGPQDWIEAEARMTGFLQEVREAQLRTRAPIVGDWSANFGYFAGRELLRTRDFTAVFTGNDQMALGFIHACTELGLRVPHDVSVVGFDDIPEAAHFLPPLTTVRQNFTEIARRAISLLLAELRGEDSLEHGQLSPDLIVRESTAAAPPR